MIFTFIIEPKRILRRDRRNVGVEIVVEDTAGNGLEWTGWYTVYALIERPQSAHPNWKDGRVLAIAVSSD